MKQLLDKNSALKLIFVCGARPNFMKVAPMFREIFKCNNCLKTNKIEPILVHTGQHYDYEMSEVFFKDLELVKPDIHLGIGSGTHAEQTGKTMIEFEKVILKEKPDIVVVVGDVNSTLAAALAASKLHISVAHIEAGLRYYDKKMPEEINRLLTDHISDYLFTPSIDASENLKREGISDDKIFFVGNIMIDSLIANKKIASQHQTISQFNLEKNNYVLCTIHRPENVDNKKNLFKIMNSLNEISLKVPVVFPIHPRTKKRLQESNLLEKLQNEKNQLIMTEAIGYHDFLNLEMNSKLIITDSGGIQVESTALGIPCLTLGNTTGWTDTISQGTNTLVDIEPPKIIAEALKIFDGETKVGNCPTFWDGKTAERIVNVLIKNNFSN